MRVHVPHVLPTIRVDNSISVYRQLLIGVYCHQNYSYKQVHKNKNKAEVSSMKCQFSIGAAKLVQSSNIL